MSTSASGGVGLTATIASNTFIATSSNPPPTAPGSAPTSNPSTSGTHNKSIIIGAVVGSVVATASVLLGACYFILRARRWARTRRSSAGSEITYTRLPVIGVGGRPMEKGQLPSVPAIFRIPAEDMDITRPSEMPHSQYPSRISLPPFIVSS